METTITTVAHTFMVEMEADTGYRFWSEPMPEEAIDAYIARYEALDYGLSDIDHAGTCAGCAEDNHAAHISGRSRGDGGF